MRAGLGSKVYGLMLCVLMCLIVPGEGHSADAEQDSVAARYYTIAAAADASKQCSEERGYLKPDDRARCQIRRCELLSLRFQQFAQDHPESDLADDALRWAVMMETKAAGVAWHRDSSTYHDAPDVNGAARALEQLLSNYPDSELNAEAIQEFVKTFREMDPGNERVARTAVRLMNSHKYTENSWTFRELVWPYYLETLHFDELVAFAEEIVGVHAETAPMSLEEARALSEIDLERARRWRAEHLLACVGEMLHEYKRLNYGYPPGRYFSWGLLYDLIQPYGKHIEGKVYEIDPFDSQYFLEFVEYESDGAGYSLTARITLESEVDKMREIGPETRAESWSRYPLWKIRVVNE